jgi:hypothetical protein
MAGSARLSLVVGLGLILAGCSKSDPAASTAGTAADGTNAAQRSQGDATQNQIAQVASDFLDAILKGDTQRGAARLTPEAKQKIFADGMTFDPPGEQNPSFQIAGVGLAQDQPDHAFVQYQFSFTDQGRVVKEDMACALRLVNNTWCVYGLVHGTGPGKPWNLRNFETGTDTPVLPSVSNSAQQDVSTASRPSPPRAVPQGPANGNPTELR